MTLKSIIISCGGTGGHFYPGLSIAREFNLIGGRAVLAIGGKHADEQLKIAKKYEVEAFKVTASPVPGNPLKALPFLLTTLRGVKQCRMKFKEYQPQAVLAMGCFASLPPAIAARRNKVPLFLHEGNALLGKANKFLSRFAVKLALSFPTVNIAGAHCPHVITGLPLRQEIISSEYTKSEAIRLINEKYGENLDSERPLILVFGGSLGAATINNNIVLDDSIPDVESLQLIHLSGAGRDAEVRERFATAPCKVMVLESCPDMQILYSASDLVISRAGGSTVSELALFGKYAVLIPYPFAAEHHQDDNARWLAQTGGAMVVSDSEATPERFRELISDWIQNRGGYIEKGFRSREIASPRAARNVIDMIAQNIG